MAGSAPLLRPSLRRCLCSILRPLPLPNSSTVPLRQHGAAHHSTAWHGRACHQLLSPPARCPRVQAAAAAAAGPGARLTAAKRRALEARQELAELNDEYALLRKLKKGKISQVSWL